MREFQHVSEEYIRQLITSGKKNSCHLDPIPTSLLIEALDILLPTITNIVNKSISENTMPNRFKSASVTPLLKKTSLDIEDKNYRPVGNKKTIVEQLNSHLTENSLHRTHQSAYRKGHSTETALLKIMNYLLKALDKQQSALLVLLVQSAAFDTDLLLFDRSINQRPNTRIDKPCRKGKLVSGRRRRYQARVHKLKHNANGIGKNLNKSTQQNLKVKERMYSSADTSVSPYFGSSVQNRILS